jgi:hypothetical protein
MADARNGDVDAMDHHQEPAHHLAGQRAALMRLELMRLQQPHTGLPNDDGRLSGAQHARRRHVRYGPYCGARSDIATVSKKAALTHRKIGCPTFDHLVGNRERSVSVDLAHGPS